MNEQIKSIITSGQTALGIEFASTRIKSVLVGPDNAVIAIGGHNWENQLVDGIWTYSMDAIHSGLQASYADMAAQVEKEYGVKLTNIGCIGISAMMHGYLPFDGEDQLLVPFRTWRNSITQQAAYELTDLFGRNIPQRWSIAHLDQAILNGEAHVPQIRFLTTLEGYIHWQLTGRKVLGVGEGSGMFPVDVNTYTYDEPMMAKFEDRIAKYNFPWKLKDILPTVLMAGDDAGTLTEAGALLLDPTGTLQPGARFCPPEGDVETGMVATNSVAPRTGNVSAGTSCFVTVVLEKPLAGVHHEIDLVCAPTGKLGAMVHCNNCTTDINSWVGLFRQFAETFGMDIDANTLYTKLFQSALQGDADCAGLLSYNYDSGEHVTGLAEGRPLFVREPGRELTLSNFMRTLLMSALSTLKIGMDILYSQGVEVDTLYGHGGYFKTPVVGQKMVAAALNAPITVMETAGEGGAWGMAVLAAYTLWREPGQSLENYLATKVFAGMSSNTMAPDAADVAGFNAYGVRYAKGLAVEAAAVENL